MYDPRITDDDLAEIIAVSQTFESLPRGARARCAKKLGVSYQFLSAVLNGRTKNTSLLRRAQKWAETLDPNDIPSGRNKTRRARAFLEDFVREEYEVEADRSISEWYADYVTAAQEEGVRTVNPVKFVDELRAFYHEMGYDHALLP